MNEEKLALLEEAMAEAERFLGRAAAAKRALQTNEYASITGTPETAAAKRASMDLTRALANLRRGRRA